MKVNPGALHGMYTALKDRGNEELLALIEAGAGRAAWKRATS